MTHQLITVFGGAGFIGRYLVRKLASDGWRIRVVSRTPGLCGHLQPLGEVGQIVVQQADGMDEPALARLLEGSAAVVNLVGILFETSKQRFDEIHGELPGRIARAALATGAERMVHVSAIGADPQSTSSYARSKAEGEKTVHAAFSEATIIRPSIVIGPEDDFFNRFAAMARLSPILPLIGGGKTRFQPIYVGDVANAIMAALQQDTAKGETVEIGGPEVYSFEELLRYLLQVTGRKRLLLPLSFALASLQARAFELLPTPPLTRDQVELLKVDNVVGNNVRTLGDLGLSPTPIEMIVPRYLARYGATPADVARS